MREPTEPAFYARSGSAAARWWTLLHPPYTVWHLSYVVLGAALAPGRDWTALLLSVLAFFLGVGVAAHALDELHGHPLATTISDRSLALLAGVALLGAAALGVYGAFFHHGTNWLLTLAIPVGGLLVVGYNLELLGGRMHNDAVFAWAWGGFPVVIGYVAQSPSISASGLLSVAAATLAAVGLSHAQRVLSTPARRLRRHIVAVTGEVTTDDGTVTDLGRAALLEPLEGALRALSWAVPLVAVSVLVLP